MLLLFYDYFACNFFPGGYYIYIETSAPRKPNDKARLLGPKMQFNQAQPKCFTFWYSMVGDHIKDLNIYLKQGNTLGTPVWKRSGYQGSNWKQGSLTITKQGTYQVWFLLLFNHFTWLQRPLNQLRSVSGDITNLNLAG